MKTKLAIFKLIVLLFASTYSGYSQDYQQEVFHNLNFKIDSILNKNKIPGFSLVILNKDSILYNKNYGFTDIKKKVPVTGNSRFRVGSITKSFLALGFAKLQEAGLIDLNARIDSLAPEIQIENKWQEEYPVRLIHLLEHTAGLEDIHLDDLSLENISSIHIKDILLNNQKDLLKARWEPGSRYAYSSVGYTLAGYILEKVTNKKYEDYLNETFLDPLGMRNSSFYNTNDGLAKGYDGVIELPNVYMYSRPAGSLISSTYDMSKFLQLFLNNGNYKESNILEASTIKSITIPKSSMAAKNGLKIGYGLGIRSYYRNGIKWTGHNGGGPGCLANYFYSSDLGVGCVFMMNTLRPDLEKAINEIIINTLVKKSNYKIEPYSNIENNLNEFTGYYEPSNPRNRIFHWLSILFDGITIEKNDKNLFIKSFLGKKTDLIQTSRGMFKKAGEPIASSIFLNNNSNQVVFQNGSKYYIQKPVWLPWLYRSLFIITMLSIVSVFFVTLYKFITYIFRKFLIKKHTSSNLKLYIFPFLAIVTLILGVIIVSNQTHVEFTQKNLRNILFCISTYLYAGLTLIGFYIAVSNFNKIIKPLTKYYILIVSLSSVGLTIFLKYWGILGLKLWDF